MTESNIELRGTCIFTDFSGGKQAGGGDVIILREVEGYNGLLIVFPQL